MQENLKLSSDFTIEDIHKIREHNYEVTKAMTVAEKQEYYNAQGREIHLQIQARKEEEKV